MANKNNNHEETGVEGQEQMSPEVIAALQQQLAEAQARAAAAENILQKNGLDGPVAVVSKTHKVESVSEDHPLHGKTIRFKPGHNYFRLPASELERLSKDKSKEYLSKLVDPGGTTHAINAIEMPEVMEILATRQSYLIEVVE